MSTFAIALILAAGPAEPPPQGLIRELVCRGAPDIDLRFDKDPSPLNPDMIRFVLRYKPGQQPVGTEYQSLAPGSCSWNPINDREIPAEPGILYFDAERHFLGEGVALPDTSILAAELYPDRQTIPRYLKDASHYWKFYVDDKSNLSTSHWASKYYPAVIAGPTVTVDSGGPVGKSTDRAGTSTRGTGSLRDSRPTLDAANIPLTFHEVVRKPTEYWFRFGARRAAGAIVEYGIAPPIRRTKGGVLTFHQPTRVTVRLLEEKGFAAEYSTAPVRNLTHGRKYYFVIRVPKAGSLPAQEYSGEFWALAPHVTVRFTSIDVLNDSDRDSSGEIVFKFYLAPGDQTSPSCGPTEVCYVKLGPNHWESGSKNPIDVMLSQVISTRMARIWVGGIESDLIDLADNPDDRSRNFYWNSYYGGSNSNGDWNQARAEIHLKATTDPQYRIAFKLRSRDGDVLMFEVTGQLELSWR
jgi:hypothetical protein